MQLHKQAALLLLGNFQKAFDSIKHTFIDNALKMYGFGDSIRKWIRLFFDKREALILLGGHLSKKIILEQGVPQGDVISPYIFLLCVEILALKIKFTKKLNGVIFAEKRGPCQNFR